MALGLNATLRNNMLDQITARIDGGVGAAFLRFYDGTRPATTQSDHISTASGNVLFTGTVAVTLADFASTAVGAESMIGTSAQTLADLTSIGSGTESMIGSSSQTLADATSNATGNVVVNVTGTVAVTLEDYASAVLGIVGEVVTMPGTSLRNRFSHRGIKASSGRSTSRSVKAGSTRRTTTRR